MLPFLSGLFWPFFSGAAKTLVANVNNWKSFCPDLIKTFQCSVLWNTFCLNRTEGFNSYFDPWWLVLFVNVLNLCFLPYSNLCLFSYLAVSSRASHVGSFPVFITYLSTLFEYECSTFGNFVKNVWKMLFFFLLIFWTFYRSESPLKYIFFSVEIPY